MRRIIAAFLCLLSIVALSACAGKQSAETAPKASDKYLGIWYGYKITTNKSDIVFKDYESVAKMELTCEFTEDGRYVIHYYTNGKEGEKYPQEGTYTMDGDKIVLSDGGTGDIVNGDLILTYSDGALKQYYSPVQQ